MRLRTLVTLTVLGLTLQPLSAFQASWPPRNTATRRHQAAALPVRMGASSKSRAKAKSAKKSKAGPKATKISLRGFGRPAPGQGMLLEDDAFKALYAQLLTEGANLERVAVAEFDGLRGVMALKDLAPGDEIVAIPGPSAINLGSQSDDPVRAALALLAAQERDAAAGERQAYWQLLPPPDAADLCTPDFFSEKELQMLQWPPLVTEVRGRSAAMRKALGDTAPSGDTSIEMLGIAGGRMRQLRWATFLVLSRVLTVQGPAGSSSLNKLLIPFIDMFNHRASCKHYLTGRTDGMLRVVAGEPVKAGEQVHIVYGTDATTNAEMLGHYGFVDAGAAAADQRLVAASPQMLPALERTSVAEDEALLAAAEPLPYNEQLAVRFRLALKRGAAKEAAAAAASG